MILRPFLKITAVLMAMAVISCEKPQVDKPPVDDQEQEQPAKPDQEQPVLGENMYGIDDEQFSFGSVIVSNIGEYICMAASPAEGVEDFDAIFEQDEYFYVAISPLLNGKEFDMMSEDKLFTVMSTLESAYLESVAPTMKDEITAGTCTFECKDGMTYVKAEITMADGTLFSVRLSAEEPGIIVNENIFAIGGVQKPVRTAFRLLENGTTALYLTPGGISYFDDIDITTYYAYIILDDDRCHGRTLNVDDLIAVGYVDNFNSIVVDSREATVTGTVNVAADTEDPAHYVVAVDLDFNGTTLEIKFDGNTLDANVKEVIESKLVYEGKSYGITGVVLDEMPGKEDTYAISVMTERNDAVTISLPSKFLDGNAHGFSQSPDLYIEYEGVIYSKANGSSGTVIAGINDGMIKIEATNYKNLEIVYEGPYESAI